MIKHIVMFKLHDKNNNKEENIKKLKDKLDKLKNKIPEIKRLETGINISLRSSAFDLVLIADFNNQDDLDKYRVHTDHQEVLAYLETVKEEVIVVDYQF
ncbi:MAG: Dabb family protein [Bacteroidales bacterium]|nr:Dabb family protein [Bacteroidales bacterium]